MDTLNDYYPLYPQNPQNKNKSESETSEDSEYIEKLDNLNLNKKRKKDMKFDDFNLKHSDDIWYLWCMILEFRDSNYSPLFAKMTYAKFCGICYTNSNIS